jgi:hypothetical protein
LKANSDAFMRDNAAGTESFVSYQGICDLVGQAVGKPARTQGYNPKDFELPKVRITAASGRARASLRDACALSSRGVDAQQ